MNPSIEQHSVSLIKYIDDILASFSTIKELFSVDKSSDLIDRIDDILKLVKEIDASLAVIPGSVNQLKMLYSQELNGYETVRNNLIEKINIRKAKNIQMNTMSTVHDMEIPLKEIYISYDNDMACDTKNICSDDIIDAGQYTCLNVVKMMEKEGKLLLDLKEVYTTVLNMLLNVVDLLKKYVLEFRTDVNDSSKLVALSYDNEESLDVRTNFQNKLISSESYAIYSYKAQIMKMFRVYLDIVNNYKLYDRAVSQYTSLALECFFNADSYYEFN